MFVNGKEVCKFKADNNIDPVNYNAIDKSDILSIHNYLMVETNIKYCSGLFNKCFLHYWVLVDL